ncbi:MAG: 50S ribosomal protein L13 [archaeon]|nr:50S ribosomal protein L13 [archaeon]
MNGRNAILGRLGSAVAQKIMDGEDVVVVNAEGIMITGEESSIFEDYKRRVDRGDATKRKGPFYPRRADLLFKRSVRGMIPWTTTSGRNAYRRLHVFIGTPKQFEKVEKEEIKPAMRKVSNKHTTLGSVSKHLGSNTR